MTREEAIKVLENMPIPPMDDYSFNDISDALYMAVEALVKRPEGEWIDEDGTYYANCSECGYQMDTHEERGHHNFCPNCGSDMRGNND